MQLITKFITLKLLFPILTTSVVVRRKNGPKLRSVFYMVPRAGLEPAQPKGRGILNPLCLPISPPGLNSVVRP